MYNVWAQVHYNTLLKMASALFNQYTLYMSYISQLTRYTWVVYYDN